MGKYIVEIQATAEKDLSNHKKAGNKSANLKIIKMLNELSIHPYTGTGKPEQLKYELQGYWSRRINQKDRLIYKVHENIVTVFVLSATGHYSDK